MTSLVPASWRAPVEDLRNRVASVFDRWLPRGSERLPAPHDEPWPSFLRTGGGPAIDVTESDSEILVYAELPGMSRNDFKVEVDGKRLILRGEKSASWKRNDKTFHIAESVHGAFYRAIPLPCEVRPDKTKARYKGGVLQVRMPKTDEAKSRRKRITVH